MKLLTEKEMEQKGFGTKSKLRKDRHLKTGLPYVKIGRLVRYRESDVEAFVQANLQVVGGKAQDARALAAQG